MSPVATPYAEEHAGLHPRVLLVDDDEVTLLIVGAALRDRGFVVREVASGQAALQVLSEAVPDVIVLDAIMPEQDGFDTCSRLRSLPGCENLPVLMLTGLNDEASITRAYEVGATDFFVKSQQWTHVRASGASCWRPRRKASAALD